MKSCDNFVLDVQDDVRGFYFRIVGEGCSGKLTPYEKVAYCKEIINGGEFYKEYVAWTEHFSVNSYKSETVYELTPHLMLELFRAGNMMDP